jgi:hypothetical protein
MVQRGQRASKKVLFVKFADFSGDVGSEVHPYCFSGTTDPLEGWKGGVTIRA